MKNLFNARAPTFDASAIHDTIQRALQSAGLDTSTGPLRSVTENIRMALAASGSNGMAPPPDTHRPTIDIEARVIDVDVDVDSAIDPLGSPLKTPGRFERFEFGNRAGSRSYRLYLPATDSTLPRPMVVMLHGCTQSAEDFAAGTRMNRQADEHGFLVLYPEQAGHANMSKCWNWFNPADQARDSGEPLLLAGMVREVASRHGVDERRIFVAGLSAGAAMAVILGETYPDLFAAVGAHSGLPYGSAHDMASAMAAMKGGRSGLPGLKKAPGAAVAPAQHTVHPVPTIVFHGDRDHTVQASNGAEIVRQARAAQAAAGGPGLTSSTEKGESTTGRAYTRTVHATPAGRPCIECWTLNGAGHAWSGGDALGTYTDGAGPDASAEMVRFFLAQPRSGSA